jgi:hypothetical protein
VSKLACAEGRAWTGAISRRGSLRTEPASKNQDSRFASFPADCWNVAKCRYL